MTKSRNILAPRHHWTELELSALTKRYANERTEDIANDIETQHTENGDSLSLIASVLRQQQAEIEALKTNLEHAYGLGEAGGFIKGHEAASSPVKELTDEETNDCYKEAWKLADDATGNCRSYTHMFQLLFNREFARAILRKASEK